MQWTYQYDSLPVVVSSRHSFWLRKGALEALGLQLDSARNILTLTRMGVDAPPKVNGLRRCVLNAVSFGQEREKLVRGPAHSVSCIEWAFSEKRPT